MKREIQRKLMEENQELGEAEARKIRMEKVRSSPVLGPFLKRNRKTWKSWARRTKRGNLGVGKNVDSTFL
jgi:hypothetical protein